MSSSSRSPESAAIRYSSGIGDADPLRNLGLPSPLVLGSASFTRKLILKEMGVPFGVVVRPIDEKALGDRSTDPPDQLVLNLARTKMRHLLDEIRAGRCDGDLPSSKSTQNLNDGPAQREWIVLTGDQVVTCNGAILEKPTGPDEARAMVAQYAKFPPSTVGSVVVSHYPSGVQVDGVDTATIYFSPTVSGDLVDQLLAEDAPVLSCAGGLMVEHPRVREHLVRIDGTEDSVMGLSKELVLRLLGDLREALDLHASKSQSNIK
jgi:septum formation protein